MKFLFPLLLLAAWPVLADDANGPEVHPAAALGFDTDFSKNGSIKSVALAAPTN